MAKRRYHPPSVRANAITLWLVGNGTLKIARELNLSRSTIKRMIGTYQRTGSVTIPQNNLETCPQGHSYLENGYYLIHNKNRHNPVKRCKICAKERDKRYYRVHRKLQSLPFIIEERELLFEG